MTAAYVAGLVVAFCLGGLTFGFLQWCRDNAHDKAVMRRYEREMRKP